MEKLRGDQLLAHMDNQAEVHLSRCSMNDRCHNKLKFLIEIIQICIDQLFCKS